MLIIQPNYDLDEYKNIINKYKKKEPAIIPPLKNLPYLSD